MTCKVSWVSKNAYQRLKSAEMQQSYYDKFINRLTL